MVQHSQIPKTLSPQPGKAKASPGWFWVVQHGASGAASSLGSPWPQLVGDSRLSHQARRPVTQGQSWGETLLPRSCLLTA